MRVIEKFHNFLSEPKVLRTIHGWLTVTWAVLWLMAAIFGWLSSVVFVSHLSAIALILGSWSSWQAARVEVKQEEGST